MDRTSFVALFKATSLSQVCSKDKPPSIVLGILVYLLGLGYDVQLSGSDAEKYIAESCCKGQDAGSQADPTKGAEEPSTSLLPARLTGSVQSAVDWSTMNDGTYSFVMDAENPSVEGVSGVPVCLIDQLHIRVRLGKSALVHCGRHIFQKEGESMKELVDTFGQAADALIDQRLTTCTVGRSTEGMFTMEVNAFVDERATHGIQNVDEFLSILAEGLCKGSSRSVATTTSSTLGHTSTGIPAGYDSTLECGEPSLRDTRVGYADVNPIDPQGAGQGLGPGGMMVGPHHPIFGRGRLDPPQGQEGHLPPGARLDPIGPPVTRGFFPGDFERTNEANRGNVHPDIMQPGRSQFPDWM